jgi:hypothetical protein
VDECDPYYRDIILDALSTVISASRGRVKVAISSRDEHDIQIRLKDCSNITVSASKNGQDIREYISAQVRQAIATR